MNQFVKRKLRSLDKTETTKFLLPMLGTKRHRDWFFINEHFINAYIGDESKPEYKDHIILRYHFTPTSRFIHFERELFVMNGIKAEYDNEDHTTMYVFKIPENLYNNYVKFLQGRYSEFDVMYKLQILKFWNLDRDDDNLLMSILFKTDKIINYWKTKKNKNNLCFTGEYWVIPILAKEIYNKLCTKN